MGPCTLHSPSRRREGLYNINTLPHLLAGRFRLRFRGPLARRCLLPLWRRGGRVDGDLGHVEEIARRRDVGVDVEIVRPVGEPFDRLAADRLAAIADAALGAIDDLRRARIGRAVSADHAAERGLADPEAAAVRGRDTHEESELASRGGGADMTFSVAAAHGAGDGLRHDRLGRVEVEPGRDRERALALDVPTREDGDVAVDIAAPDRRHLDAF